MSDFESQMYAPPSRIRAYYQDGGDKPFLVCEYMHCMGNSLGGFTEYDGLFDELPQYAGGFIWDFIDQALSKARPGEFALFQNETSSLAYGLEQCHKAGLQVVFNLYYLCTRR